MANQTKRNVDLDRRKLLKIAGITPIAGVLSGCMSGEDDAQGDRVPTLTFDVGDSRSFVDNVRDMAQVWNEELGLDVNVESVDFGTHASIYGDREYYEDIAWGGYTGGPDRIDPQFHLSLYHSENPSNLSFYENPEYDELFEEQASTYDEEERNELIRQMQEILYQDAPDFVYLWMQENSPVNTDLWEIEPTALLSVSSSTLSIPYAEPKGGTEEFKLVYDVPVDVHNPLSVSNVTLQYLFKSTVYDTPRKIDFDGSFRDWAVDDITTHDETTVDLRLRDGMTFHDGEPVTADDLAFTLNFLVEHTFTRLDAFTQTIDTATVENDRTVQVTFQEPDVSFLTSSLVTIPILPQHIWESIPDKIDVPANYNLESDEWVGSGPFSVTEVTTENLTFEANDDHFQPPPYDRLTYTQRPSNEAIRSAFASGDAHAMAQATSFGEAEAIADSSDAVEVLGAPGLYSCKIVMDNRNPPFDDPVFRRAIRDAVPYSTIREVHFFDTGEVTDGTTVCPHIDWGLDDPPDLTDPDTASVETAKNRLEEAGYTWDSDNRLQYPEE